ncbi:hypothetical protein C9374_010461 [Naegleria lovaniensis]|uniref:Guanylate cyclase domain-containing protein n=1 Tax=Naegleria lovaniensis TaxID=51637 RepID=A0AA88GBR6_NAELO|nr:uncharacterized protein C9374_010461 [Naegleria lovaniensis]KAG2374717.1 hypothetical protein C9374_010461 [Naegleria lovaniensis]
MGVLNQSHNSLKSLSESLTTSTLLNGFYCSSIIPESNLLKETNLELKHFAPSLSREENKQLGHIGDGTDFVIQMLQCSPMASAITDLKGNILAMNSAFKQIFKVKEVLNPIKNRSEVGHVTNFMPPEYRNQHDKHMLKFKNSNETKMKRITFGYTTEGDKIPIMLTIALTTLPSTQKPCYICFVKDLTFEFKHSTLAEMYETVTGNSSFPIIAIDEECTVKLFNKAAETTWMVTKLEVMERNVNILMPESIGKFHTKMVQNYCTGKKEGKLINRVHQVVGKRVGNGHEFPLEIKIAEIRHEINLKRSFIAFLRDLTAVMTAREFQLTLYPVSVVNQLEAGQRTIHKYHSCISVLFCDIVGFTEISRRMSSEELVKMLDEIITSFDENLLLRFGLEKIKTMGDNYMCASGLDSNPHHASNIVEAALEMQTLLIEFNKKHAADLRDRFPSQYQEDDNTISVRVGINSGELVAGIVGSKKPVYDVFGDTVNMASRMESSGIESEVQITQATYNLLRDDLKKRFVLRRNVTVKGVGQMDTYISQLRQEREKHFRPKSVENSTVDINTNKQVNGIRQMEFEDVDDTDLPSQINHR